MDEQCQNDPQNSVKSLRPNEDSAYSYNEINKKLDQSRSYTSSLIEPYEVSRDERKREYELLKGANQQKSLEMISSLRGDPEGSYYSSKSIESRADLNKSGHHHRKHRQRQERRSPHSKHKHRKHRHHRSKIELFFDRRRKKKFGKCWRNFRRLFKPKHHHRHHHHKKRRHGKHRDRSQKLDEMREKFQAMQAQLISQQKSKTVEGKDLRPKSSQPASPVLSMPKAEKEKEEKVDRKLEEKAVEPAKEKETKLPLKVTKVKVVEEEPQVERTIDDELEIRQRNKMSEFIKQFANIGMKGIKKEFVSIRSFIPIAVTRNVHNQNLIRCRYPDLICIDQTRVVLKGNEDSDFIHANRLQLGDNPNEIIITQLPVLNTVKHFWNMIWQENVEAILLLLTLNEWKKHAENIHLIPEKGRCLHIEDSLMLTHKNEIRVAPVWTMHEFYLSKNNETRRILWHHYSAWEPNRSPKSGELIWPLHSSLRNMRRPYVCMSLAGAGRAGTYAALECAHVMLHDRNVSSIDITECVRKVRAYRMHAVQTIAQYQFIYMALQRHIFLTEKIRKVFLSDSTTVEAMNICSAMESKYYQSDNYPTEEDFDL